MEILNTLDFDQWRSHISQKNKLKRFGLQYYGLLRKMKSQVLNRYFFWFLMSIVPWTQIILVFNYQSNEHVADFIRGFQVFWISDIFSQIIVSDKKHGILNKLRKTNLMEDAYILAAFSWVATISLLNSILVLPFSYFSTFVSHFVHIFCASCFAMCFTSMFKLHLLNFSIRCLTVVLPYVIKFILKDVNSKTFKNIASLGLEQNSTILDSLYPLVTLLFLFLIFAIVNHVCEHGRTIFFGHHAKSPVSSDCVHVNISKFTRKKQVLCKANFELEKQTATAIYGPNGSGKSTLFDILTGSLSQTRGTSSIFGHKSGSFSALDSIGVCLQQDALIFELNAVQNMQLFCCMKGIDLSRQNKHCQLFLDALHIDSKLPVSKLSSGMRRRLSVAISCLGFPKLLLLDEPTNRQDTTNKNRVWNLIKLLKKSSAVLFISHSLCDIENLSDQIMVVDNGIFSTMNVDDFWDPDTCNLVVKLQPNATFDLLNIQNVRWIARDLVSFQFPRLKFGSICNFLESEVVLNWREEKKIKVLEYKPLLDVPITLKTNNLNKILGIIMYLFGTEKIIALYFWTIFLTIMGFLFVNQNLTSVVFLMFPLFVQLMNEKASSSRVYWIFHHISCMCFFIPFLIFFTIVCKNRLFLLLFSAYFFYFLSFVWTRLFKKNSVNMSIIFCFVSLYESDNFWKLLLIPGLHISSGFNQNESSITAISVSIFLLILPFFHQLRCKKQYYSTFKNVTVKNVFHDVSFTLKEKMCALIGPNGGGKNQIARLITGKLTPTTGCLQDPVKNIGQRQTFLFPNSSLYENLLVLMQIQGCSISESNEFLKSFDLETKVCNLSTGTRRFWEMLIINNPELIIAQDPTESLDPVYSEVIMNHLQNQSSPVLLITHDSKLLDYTSNVVYLNRTKLFVGWIINFYCKKSEYKQKTNLIQQLIPVNLTVKTINKDCVITAIVPKKNSLMELISQVQLTKMKWEINPIN